MFLVREFVSFKMFLVRELQEFTRLEDEAGVHEKRYSSENSNGLVISENSNELVIVQSSTV